MRTHRPPAFTPDHPDSPIASLIDVAFLLLIFFIVTSTLLKRETDLQQSLPGDRGTASSSDPAVNIRVADDGAVEIGEDRWLELVEDAGTGLISDALHDRLKPAVLAAGPDPLPVVLDVEDEVSHQRFIAVLDCLAGLGIDQIHMVDR